MIASIFFMVVDSPFKVALQRSIIVPIEKAQARAVSGGAAVWKLGNLRQRCLFLRHNPPKN
jgi:hypothetical protein